MDIRVLSPAYAVSPQIAPEDVSTIAAAGYKTILCNRPDGEVPPSHQAGAIKAATEAAGLRFVDNPFSHGQLTQALLDAQAATMADEGPVLAYCASGNRCTILWLIVAAQAGEDLGPLIEAGEAAGYPLAHMRPQLEAMGRQ